VSDIIDLNAEREKRDGPDKELVTMIDGEKWFIYVADYVGPDGKEYSFRFWARSPEDALTRLHCIKDTGTFSGQLYCEIAE
jgi:hypothetical protein